MFRDIPSVPLHTPPYPLSHFLSSSLSFFTYLQQGFHRPLVWRSLYSSLVSRYPNYTEVFCDGSLQDTLCGCAVWCASFSLQAKLPTGTSIFTAELYAIFSAATYVSTLPVHFHILTDSLSSVTALSSHHPCSHNLVPKISTLLFGLPSNRAIVQWVSSHVGISGNEMADDMARGSLRLSYITQIPFSTNDLRRRINTYYNTL